MTEADRILDAVCRTSGITKTHLLSSRRSGKYWAPRQLAYFLMHERTGLSLPQIGRKMGGRDHTTVLWGLRRWNAIASKPENRALLTDTLKLLGTIPADGLPISPIGVVEAGRRDRAVIHMADIPKGVRVTTTAVNRQRWMRAGPPPASLRVLTIMHRLGCNCTVAQVSDETDINEYTVRQHLPPLLWTGYITSERRGNQHTDGGSCAFITPILDVNGQPCTPTHDARPVSARPVKPRQCNRCRQTFQPESRFNFRCGSCDRTIKDSPDYSGAAPGMEFVA